MSAPVPLTGGGYNVDPVVLASKDTSSVIIWTPPNEENAELKFRVFTGPPSLHGINLNRELQVPIIGTLGVFRLLTGWFIVVINENILVGTIDEHTIYKASKFQVFPIPAQAVISDDEKKIQTQFLTNLNNMLLSCGFYYSPTYDITQSKQRQASLDKSLPIWRRVDPRFYWNAHFMEKFIENDIEDWILPVIDGHVEINPWTARLGPYSFILISRRECYRTGARFHTRGADPDGHCANFAETEQLIVCNGNVSSWVQTRGSIPLIWFQPRSINPAKAKPTVDYSPFSSRAFQKHIDTQIALYGKHLLVSLIDHKGNEQEVGETFETKMRLLAREDARYIAFDFHEECKNNNYSRIEVLLNLAKDSLNANGYFLQDSTGKVMFQQCGNVRTNCIDCLDRTNVVQSQFGRYMLKVQLANLGIIPHDEEFDRNFVNMLNNVWANNADTLSKRYTGVGALKTDFTRTGKRSAKGAMADGVKSVSRLYHSTFNDDTKQDATEFFLGKFSFERLSRFSAPSDNVKTYKALKKTTWDSKGKTVLLGICNSTGELQVYSPDEASLKFLQISDLYQVARYTRHYCGLSLLFSSSVVSKKFIFSSVMEREKFIIHIDEVREKYAAPPANASLIDFQGDFTPASITPEHTEVPLKVFVGSINHNVARFDEPPSLEGYIPRDRDLYVVGCQNCYYRVPSGYYFSPASHWVFTILQHLGNEFEIVKIASVSNRLVTAILVRKTMLFDISNIELSYTVLCIPRQESPAPSKSNKGFGGLLRSITSEVKKGFTAPDSNSNYSESDYTGIAISLSFHETSICFINSSRCDLPFRVLDFDIANDFHHVVLFGDITESRLNNDYWIPLFQDNTHGSIYWRMLLDSKLDAILASRPDPSSAIPVSVCFTLKAVKYLYPCATEKAKIVLHDLSATNLEGGDKTIRLFDAYLIVHSACATRHGRTATKPKSVSPAWDEILTLPTVPTYKEYLRTQHLVACVYDQEEGYLIGKGVIRLCSAMENLDEPQDFVVRLSVLDETRGALRGKLHITFDELALPDVPVSPPATQSLLDL